LKNISAFAALIVSASVWAVTAQSSGRNFYAAPNGSASNDGSLSRPLNLATALSSSGPVRAGDTLWLRGGTYSGRFRSTLRGTSSSPIVVRGYPGERATLDGGTAGGVTFGVGGAYVHYMDFEVTSSSTDHLSAQVSSWPSDLSLPEGISTDQATGAAVGVKFINLVVHDTRQAFSFWQQALNAEIYGCIIYNNGWNAPDRGHGHGIYAQNDTGTKRLADNILFNQHSHGFHAYGTEAARINNFVLEGNIAFNNGALAPTGARNILLGGGYLAQSPRIISNLLYYSTGGQNLNVGYEPYGVGAANAVVTGNYIVDGAARFSSSNTNMTMTGNSFVETELHGVSASQYPSNTYQSQLPSTPRVFVRPNQYQRGRAHIVVFNGGQQGQVNVDISSAGLTAGERFEIRDVQNYYGSPVVSSTYSGGSVTLPMSGLQAAAPRGTGVSRPAHTAPRFGVFVLSGGSGGSTTPPAPAPSAPSNVRIVR
jgi:hypothetical protein